jgi:SRSO17 transposase
MLPIGEIPEDIRQACAGCEKFFARKEQFESFLMYLTGLIVSAKGNIAAIADLFWEELEKDQSNLNRFVTESDWEAEAVEAERIHRFQEHPVLKPGKAGVIGIDDVLLEKSGEQMEGVGVLKDHSTGQYVLAHCLVTSSYYKGNWCYPLYHAPYFKESVCQQEGWEFQSKVTLAKEIAGKIIAEGIAGVFAFDAWYLCQDLVGFLEEKGRLWVSRMKKNRKVKYRGQWRQGQELARELKAEAYARVEVGGKVYWWWSGMMEISELTGKKRVVILWEEEVGKGEPVFLATNAYWWHRERVVAFYRGRWGEETLHRDGKQHLGLGEYQMRKIEGVKRHWCLVMSAYSLLVLRAATKQGGAKEQPRPTVGTMTRRVMAQVVQQFVNTVIQRAHEGEEAVARLQQQLTAFFQRFDVLSTARKLAVT